jgi:transketolase
MIELEEKIKDLQSRALTVRHHIIDMVEWSKSGHPGASLSAVELLTTLYFSKMNVDSQNPTWEDRDRFVLSKGHATPVLYAVLAEKGFFPKEELRSFRQLNSRLQGHPDMKKTPGVEMTTGSLGQGFASTLGMCLGLREKGKSSRVYALLGDGELNEGIVWEAATIAAHYRLDNLTAIIDKNDKQAGGLTKDVLNMENLAAKWNAFGWNVIEIDGHDIADILASLQQASAYKGKPTVIIAQTVKGKGISFMEKGNEFYGEKLTVEEIRLARQELAGKGV